MYSIVLFFVAIVASIGYFSLLIFPPTGLDKDEIINQAVLPYRQDVTVWPTGSLALIMAIISAGILVNTNLYQTTKQREMMNILLLACIFKASVDDLYIYKFNLIIYISSVMVYSSYLKLINQTKDSKYLILPAITFIGSTGYYLYGKQSNETFLSSDPFYLLMLFITPIALLLASSPAALGLLAVSSLIVYNTKFSMFIT